MQRNLSNIETIIKENNKHSIYVTHGGILGNIVTKFNNYTVFETPEASFIASDKDNNFSKLKPTGRRYSILFFGDLKKGDEVSINKQMEED